MMYICRMVHKINGEIIRYFGTKEECLRQIESISDEYVSEIRQARMIEIKAQVEIVEDRREKIKFNCSFATKIKKPQYLESLERVDRELVRLNEAIAKIESRRSGQNNKGKNCAA